MNLKFTIKNNLQELIFAYYSIFWNPSMMVHMIEIQKSKFANI